jgi:hypothetical protein
MKTPMLPRLALLLVLAAVVPAPAKELKTGVFELKTKDLNSRLADLGLDKLAMIDTKDGLAVASKQDSQQWQVLGLLDANDAVVNLTFPRGEKPAGKLTITSKDGSFIGELNVGGEKIPFKGSVLGGLYRCGNHPKAHLADGLKQMAELTKAHGCVRWKTDTGGDSHQLDLNQIANLQGSK